ncbi:MAG TPA: alcohol dehydrogenase [Candidatus Acidoferrum sp.]|nr:alcohol dehydrogenase [Candidatus Acidoferrum sp.]
MPSKMRVGLISKAHSPIEIAERPIPTPGPGQVRIKVNACGVCHSDVVAVEGLWPGITYPRVPGHEVAGVIDTLGESVAPEWKVGDRVGVGWFGGNCGHCEPCRRGDFMVCKNLLITGIHFDGGYAEYMVAPFTALARIPDSLNPVEAGPLLCAGVTTFNSLRNANTRAGSVVAVLGIGGLGHLGVQYASRMGFRTVAIARGKDKESLARKLGAHHYIDNASEDPAKALQALGGATAIVATATSGAAMASVIGGLAPGGKLIVLGAAGDPLQVDPVQLLAAKLSVVGWPSGTSIDSEDTMNFSALNGVRAMNEVYPLDRAPEAYARMMSGNALFRVVLTVSA